MWRNPKRKRGRYTNPYCANVKRTVWDVILWFCGHYKDLRPKSPPRNFHFPLELPPLHEGRPSLTWIGHSTFLIQLAGANFLTDPIFSAHCSPIPIRALKRLHPPALSIEELPVIDGILISHNHYDHLDRKSIRQLHLRFPHATWLVSKGLKRWFFKRGIRKVVELGWGEATEIKGVRITAVPAQHFSGRGLLDKNRTLWCGFVGESQGKTFYFVGDTGYNPIQFKQIGERWPTIDLSMIPIGTYLPKQFMEPVHISPYEAVQIHQDVCSRMSVGMHWNTFTLSEEDRNMPPYDLFLALQKHKLPLNAFLPLPPGIKINW
jgi:N-acyl-phosphatidylethanolamine-hydrolysing phospholipase D